MMTSVRCADIRVSLWSGCSCWRIGVCGGIGGGASGGPLDFLCDNTILVRPTCPAPLLYWSARLAVILYFVSIL